MNPSVLECIARLVQAGFTSWGCPEEATAHWTPPVEGMPVHHYVVEIMTTATTQDTTIAIPVPDGFQYVEVRVAGVDSTGRQGEWSDWSDRW